MKEKNKIEESIIEESMIAYQNDIRKTKKLNNNNLTENEIDLEEEWYYKKLEPLFGENYKERLFKENFKGFSNLWDRIIDWSINSGNSHYAITINILDTMDEYIKDKDDYEEFVENTINMLADYLKIVTYIMIVPEYNKKGKLHLHGIIFIKNIMDYNKNIKGNILNFLKENLRPKRELNYHGYPEFGKPAYDIKVDYLKSFLDIKKWNMYLYKEHSKWSNENMAYYCPDITFIDKWRQAVLAYTSFSYLKFNIKNYRLYTDRYDEIIEKIEWREIEHYIKKENIYNLTGIKIVKNELSDSIIIDLILNFLTLNNFYIHKNNIYKKLKNYKISYEKIDSIENMLYVKFKENIINFFNVNFIAQFENFNSYFLIKENFKNVEKILKRIEDINTLKIEPKTDVMEFRDGIYFIKYNTFLQKRLINDLKISTLKFYDKNYDTVRKKDPKNWIQSLLKVLDFKGDFKNLEIFKYLNENNIKIKDIKDNQLEKFIKICIFIASIFQNKTDNKKKFLYIQGKTSTGKTTLLTKVLTRYFGEENIGTMTGEGNFKLQDIYGKELVIIDEFVYDEKLKGDLLKLFGGEKLLISKKYEREHKTIEVLCGIILSNSVMRDDDYRTNEALNARVEIIEFLQKIGVDKNRDKLLKEEEAEIIIFCNKLYFAINPTKKYNIKTKKMIKLLENKI